MLSAQARVDVVTGNELLVEVLLNVAWAALAFGALAAFGLRQRRSRRRVNAADLTALIALSTLLLVLFPVISVSDDFHPAMVVLEDPARRISQLSACLHHMQDGFSALLLSAIVIVHVLTPRHGCEDWPYETAPGRLLQRERLPHDGRSPPSF